MSDEISNTILETEPLTGSILTAEEEKTICDFLESEITLAENERAGEERLWSAIRRQRIGRPESAFKNSPWPNASNVCVPGAMIAANTMYGITRNAFEAKNPQVSVTALEETSLEDQEIAAVVQEYLATIADSPLDLNKSSVDREIHEETDVLGACFVKVLWETEEAQVRVKTPEGAYAQSTARYHDGPRWIVIPREEFYYRLGEKSLQRARWCAQRVVLEEMEVRERFAKGEWQEWEGWEKAAREEPLEHEEAAAQNQEGTLLQKRVWDFFEVFLRWDVEPKDNIWEDLLVVYSRQGSCLVRADFNPFGRRPIREFVFLRLPFRLDGIGTGAAALHMQAELDTNHNQRQDASHISGLRMIVARRNCGIKARETLKPGKILFVDNVKEDITSFQLGEPYASSIASENMSLMYLQKATLMTDAAAGFADQTLKTRDSIGLQTMRLRASSGVIGSILSDMEDSYTEAWLFTFFQLAYNRDRVLERERKLKRFSEKKLALLEKALSVDLTEIPLKLRFSVKTTDVEQTFEVRRQNMLTLVSLYGMYVKTILPLLMQIYMPNPQTGQPLLPAQMQEWALRVVTGNSRLMEKIFQFFGEEDTSRFIPSYKKIEMALDLKAAMEEQLLELARRQYGTGSEGASPVGGPAGGAGLLGGAGGGGIPQAFGGAAPTGGQNAGNLRPGAAYLPGAGSEAGIA